MRAAIYARVSTADSTIDAPENRCETGETGAPPDVPDSVARSLPEGDGESGSLCNK
jgi:hypothetical protein